MVRGYRTFREFQEAGEGIATNILSDRLRKLTAAGIVEARPDADDARRLHYTLTEKGIDLAPLLLDLLLWGARHGETRAPAAVIRQIQGDREGFLREVRRRWAERDPTPLIPRFGKEKA